MLKKLSLLTIILFSFTITTNAQLPISLEINAGLASSEFENQESSASSFVLGAAVLIDIIPIIDAGVEFNTLASPFKFESEGSDRTQEVSQTYIGVFGRFNVLPLVAVNIYLKGAVGMYSGKLTDSELGEFDYNSSIGGNLGLGVSTMFGLYGEFVYHIVTRELDVEGASSEGYNNWMLVAGYRFGL